jgi:hypothetical protein
MRKLLVLVQRKLLVPVLLFALALVAFAGDNPRTATVTIANGASLSGAMDLGERTLVGIVMPSAWTAASLTFQVSVDGTTYGNLYSAGGTEESATVGVSQVIRLASDSFLGARYVKIRSGTAGAPVNQGAARTIILITKRRK